MNEVNCTTFRTEDDATYIRKLLILSSSSVSQKRKLNRPGDEDAQTFALGALVLTLGVPVQLGRGILAKRTGRGENSLSHQHVYRQCSAPQDITPQSALAPPAPRTTREAPALFSKSTGRRVTSVSDHRRCHFVSPTTIRKAQLAIKVVGPIGRQNGHSTSRRTTV
jgi:hypothetical protein